VRARRRGPWGPVLWGAAGWALAGWALAGWALAGCEAERDLSGLWRQAPRAPGEDAWDEGLAWLYELHLGRYAETLTGLVVRYQVPSSRFLSPFERADRCDCSFVARGAAEDAAGAPEALAFSLLDPGTRRALEAAPSCALPAPECERLFRLAVEGDDLVGETWCAGEAARQALRFTRVSGLTASSCAPVEGP